VYILCSKAEEYSGLDTASHDCQVKGGFAAPPRVLSDDRMVYGIVMVSANSLQEKDDI